MNNSQKIFIEGLWYGFQIGACLMLIIWILIANV